MPLKIAMMLPAVLALDGPGNGVRRQAEFQAEALRRQGADVKLLSPWVPYAKEKFDVLHFLVGGPAFQGIEAREAPRVGCLSFAPIIDSNEPNWRYRVVATVGSAHPKFFTIPGLFRKQALGSDVVICRSKFEQERVVRGLGIPLGKSQIVLNGVEPVEDASPEEAFALLGRREPYVLHVSSYTQPRKNVVRLIEAVGPTGLPLVIAGTCEAGPTLRRIDELIVKFPNVRRLQFLSEALLKSVYAGARVFALPSAHEGTGLVALEAAAAGRAAIVITRNGGTLDYFGDDAEYVDPTSTADIRTAVKNAWDKPQTDVLRARIRTQLTWDESAKALLAAFTQHLRAGG